MDKQRINDCHIHLGDSPEVNRSVSGYEVLTHRVRNNIDKVLLMGDNQQVKSLVQEHDGLYGLHWLSSPIENITLDNKIIGCKYHGAYTKKPISDKWSYVLESLDKINGVILIHCGRYKDGVIESNTSFIHALTVAKQYPNLKVIMAHMGGTDTNICKHAIHYSRDYDNVYFDTSGITTPYIIEYACQSIPSKRIMFGSDVPWCSYNAMYHTVLDAHVVEEDKQNIFYNSFNDLVSKCEYLQIT